MNEITNDSRMFETEKISKILMRLAPPVMFAQLMFPCLQHVLWQSNLSSWISADFYAAFDDFIHCSTKYYSGWILR